MLLSDNESKAVWDRVYKTLHFQPNMNCSVIPFEIERPYVVYDISSMSEGDIDKMHDVITRIFIECTREDEYLYALDWHHSNFKFNPRNKEEQKSIYIEDKRYMHNGYMAYFPTYYPDGDYYFFIASDLKFGYLGHPWQQKVWIFGKELIKAFESNVGILGFVLVEKVE